MTDRSLVLLFFGLPAIPCALGAWFFGAGGTIHGFPVASAGAPGLQVVIGAAVGVVVGSVMGRSGLRRRRSRRRPTVVAPWAAIVFIGGLASALLFLPAALCAFLAAMFSSITVTMLADMRPSPRDA